jgi:pimeloyl-ACP methyl ester carboxylesterase
VTSPIIHHDQIGNGKSTHLRDKRADFWTVDFFLGELDAALPRQHPNGRRTVCASSSHMPHVEEKEACLAAVERFIAKHD